MTFDNLKVMLAMAPPPSNGEKPNPTQQMISFVSMLVLMGVVFYFALIRPQQKRARAVQDMVSNLKNGDKVVTNSGIVGVVITVKEKTVTIRSGDSKFEITKGAVAEITERASAGENATS